MRTLFITDIHRNCDAVVLLLRVLNHSDIISEPLKSILEARFFTFPLIFTPNDRVFFPIEIKGKKCPQKMCFVYDIFVSTMVYWFQR